MPTYKYNCNKCNKQFHEFTAMDERDMVQCPDCHAHSERIFEGCTNIKFDHLGNVEKGIKQDLVEVNKLEREAAYGNTRYDREDQLRIKKEVERLKYTD